MDVSLDIKTASTKTRQKASITATNNVLKASLQANFVLCEYLFCIYLAMLLIRHLVPIFEAIRTELWLQCAIKNN